MPNSKLRNITQYTLYIGKYYKIYIIHYGALHKRYYTLLSINKIHYTLRSITQYTLLFAKYCTIYIIHRGVLHSIHYYLRSITLSTLCIVEYCTILDIINHCLGCSNAYSGY